MINIYRGSGKLYFDLSGYPQGPAEALTPTLEKPAPETLFFFFFFFYSIT